MRLTRVLALVGLVAVFARTASAEEIPGSVNGLYPMWEQTGNLHQQWSGELGLQSLELSLGRVEVGTNPLFDYFGTYNANAKVALYRSKRLRLAAVAAWYHIPTNAQGQEFGNLNALNINKYDEVHRVPISVASSMRVTKRLELHLAATMLTQYTINKDTKSMDYGSSRTDVAVGTTSVLEYHATKNWSAMLHGGVEGMPVETQEHVGMSIAFRTPYLEASGGLAERFEEGQTVRVVMFNGGLLF